jgi:large subunit ribosomal protein L17
MRHRSASHNFARHPAHRRAMMRNIVMNLFEHGRIRTTVQKAKAAKPLAEKLITLGKKGTLRDRHTALRELGSTTAAKAAVRILFGDLSQRFASRNGGYTRILHLPRTIRQATVDLPRTKGFSRSKIYGTRLRDNADLVLFELCEAEITKPQRKPRKVKSKKPKVKTAPAKAEPVAAPPAEQKPAQEQKAE